VAPLRKAADAVEVDTSEMTLDEVVDAVVRVIREKVGA
jgi:cytidylate kinase